MTNSEALQAFVDAWNTADAQTIADRFAPDGARHQMAIEETVHTGDGLLEHFSAILTAVPNPVLQVRNTVDDGKSIVLEWTFVGTVDADFGPIPGNGQHLELKGSSTLSFNEGGLVQHEAVYWDTATLMAGAGMLG